jgi:type IV fimbrial biogenesis protein FimT
MFRGEKQQGFTLIELMVTLAIAMIVIALSTPISNLFKQNRVTTQVHEFVTSLNMARSSAITHGTTASLCISNGATPPTCDLQDDDNKTWENGWLVFTDVDGDCSFTAGTDELIKQHAPLGDGFSLRINDHECIQYNANGITGDTNGTLTLCDPSGKDTFKRGIEISRTGRARIVDTKTPDGALAACP